jgi:hypothetical protein
MHLEKCWNFRTIYEGWELSRNRVVIPARQAAKAGGIDSLESIAPGLLKSLKNRHRKQPYYTYQKMGHKYDIYGSNAHLSTCPVQSEPEFLNFSGAQ